jgi:hypothetical protein
VFATASLAYVMDPGDKRRDDIDKKEALAVIARAFSCCQMGDTRGSPES